MIIHSACGLLLPARPRTACQMHKKQKPLAELLLLFLLLLLLLLLLMPGQLVQAYWGAIL